MSITADKVIVELEARLGKYNADVNAARANFDQNMGKIRASAQSTERQSELSAAKIGRSFGEELIKRASVAAVVTGLFQIGKAAADVARQAEELDSAIGFTFGKNAGMIQQWADTTGAAMGRSSTDLKQAALDFQTLFDPALGADAAAEMSKKFAVLVQDLASFRNVSEDIVRQNLVSGLVGETEPLRKYGILINDNMVKTKALEMGLVKAGQQVNDYGKIVARIQLILEATATAQGDVARTSESSTNQLRAANAATKELSETIGSGLNPMLAAMAGWWAGIAKAIDGALHRLGEFQRRSSEAMAQAFPNGVGGRTAYEYDQARRRAAGRGEYLPTAADIKADSARGPRSRGRNRAALGITPADDAANAPPSYVDTGAGGGGGRAKVSKPRFGGALPDYILKGVADGRYTEASVREWYPDGNFPKDGFVELPPAKTFVEAVDAASKAETIAASSVIAIDETGGRGFKAAGEGIAEALGPATEAYATMRQNFASAFADGAIQALQSGDVGGALEQMLLQYGMQGLRAALEGLGSTLFSMGSGGPLGSGGSTLGDLASSVLKLIPGFASGTSSAPGGLAYVHKDELINLPKGSQVYTAAQTRAMTRGGGGSQPVNVKIEIASANTDRQIFAIARQATMQGVSAGLNAANRSETGRRFTETLLGARPL